MGFVGKDAESRVTEKALPVVPWSRNAYAVMQRCVPSYAPVLGFSLISSSKRRVGFNGSWKTYLWLGLKLEYLCMHSCCSYTVVSIKATLAKWSWVQRPFLSQCTSGRNICFRSGAFADCQDVTVRQAAGVDPSLMWSLQAKSQSQPLAFYLVVGDQKKGDALFFSNCKWFVKFYTHSNFLWVSNIILGQIWIHRH